MIQLTSEAQHIRDEYLRQVRAYVSASGKADPKDVLRDVEEHLQREFQDAPQPVSGPALGEVLDRLGSPAQWISPEDLAWWRKMILRVRVGPEDWRLAYATFGQVLLGVIFGWVFSESYHWGYRSSRSFNWAAFVIFLVLSFLLARATLAAVGPAQMPPAQKWLVYPSLAAVYAAVAVAILICVPAAAGGITYALLERPLADPGNYQAYAATTFIRPSPLLCRLFPFADAQAGAIAAVFATAIGGLWWIVLFILLRGPIGRFFQFVFRPLLDSALRKTRWTLLILGVLLAVLGAGAMGLAVGFDM